MGTEYYKVASVLRDSNLLGDLVGTNEKAFSSKATDKELVL